MNFSRVTAGGLSRFAHLAGLVRPSRARASDNPPDPRNEPGEGEGDEAEVEEIDLPDGEPHVPGGGSGPENVPPDATPQNAPVAPNAPGPGGATPPSARNEYAKGFLAAQARAAAILSHGAAAGNLPLACELATGNQLPTRKALALLEAGAAGSPPPTRPSLSEQMQGQGPKPVGTEADKPDENDPQTVAASVLATLDRIRGQARK